MPVHSVINMEKYHCRSDPRLAEMLAKVNIYAKNEGPELNGEILDQKIIDRVEFKNLIIENIVLISR